MSSTTTSSSSPNGFPSQFPDNSANGIGAGVYYAAIGVAVAIIASITLLSRILYARKLRKMQRRRAEQEQEAMSRRGEAPGLPTYHESRTEGRQLDANYDLPPPDTPPPEERATGWNHYFWSHLPSIPLPAALRTRREEPEHELPAYTNAVPPKYEESHPSTGMPTTSSTETAPAIPVLSREMSERTEGADDSELPPGTDDVSHVIGEAEHEEEFIHPEERRRRDAERAARLA